MDGWTDGRTDRQTDRHDFGDRNELRAPEISIVAFMRFLIISDHLHHVLDIYKNASLTDGLTDGRTDKRDASTHLKICVF